MMRQGYVLRKEAEEGLKHHFDDYPSYTRDFGRVKFHSQDFIGRCKPAYFFYEVH